MGHAPRPLYVHKATLKPTPQITLCEVESPHSIYGPCGKTMSQGWFACFNLNQKREEKKKKSKRDFKATSLQSVTSHCESSTLLTMCVALSCTWTLLMLTHW